jgi:hypothetical protein
MNLYLRDIMLQFETVRAVRDSGDTTASFSFFFLLFFFLLFFLFEHVFWPSVALDCHEHKQTDG